MAHAEVERYAIIIGHNIGAVDEQKLRYAESDAARVAELMNEIGGVRDENQIMLLGKTAHQVRRALIALNERIRSDQRSGRDAILFVYYSGHGDADALHLGDTRLELRELEALVRGSSAQIRMLVIDSCRSGAVTRVKGGSPAPPIALSAATEVPGEGIIVLTASTSGEDAQESDQLAGSFFTHYLLSALHGAADENNDGIVTVAEAFAHTRTQTILASSRSLVGTQHPTFYYDIRGRSEVALTDLGSDKGRGRLMLPADATYLVMRGSLSGSVVGEIGADVKHRTLSLRPGTYAVRGRGRDALLEGLVEVVANRETVVDP
ncbi:MAG TPA: caspase family protein, partial [Kofleriaceae bacterium]|nr:caspase family protein [Kofleriaceae bacterium]